MMEIENIIYKSIKKIYKNKKIFLHEPVIDQDDMRSLNTCIKSKFVSTVGEGVNKFEKKISYFTNSKYVVALNSGTSCLHLSLLAAGVKKNDEVLVSGTSFISSVNSIIYCNGIPHFLDIEPEAFSIDLDKLETYLKKITIIKNGQCFNKKTGNRIKCIMVVHIFGLCNNFTKLIKISKKYKLKIIEDSAEAFGSYYKKKHLGTLGDIGILSFNGNKIITTGSGGCVLTNNINLFKKVKSLASSSKINHPYKFLYDGIGFNYKMTNVNAYLGISQLKKINKIIVSKRVIHNRYKEYFKNNKYFNLVSEISNCKSNYWLNVLILKKKYMGKRNKIIENLIKKGIFCRPLWPDFTSVKHLKKFPSMKLENAKILSKSTICLPSSALI